MKKFLLFLLLSLFSVLLLNSAYACDKLGVELDYNLSAIDPTPESNPAGANFPGIRGGDQLIKYTTKFGKYTGTNEYGTEITVVDGIVTEKNGSNSTIPENGYVLSGHGNAKKWLNNSTIIGTQISIKKNRVIAVTEPSSYIFRAEKMIDEAEKFINQQPENESNLNLEAKSYLIKAKKEVTEAKNYMQKNSNIELIETSKSSYDSAAKAFFRAIPPMNNMRKGVWCRPTQKNKEEIENTVERIKKAGITDIYLETFYHGYTIYPSNLAESYGFAKQNPNFKDFDPLKTWVEIAHAKGLKVIPWVETFYVGTGKPGPILSVKPEWANIQRINFNTQELTPSTTEPGAFFTDPANPGYRTFLIELLDEMSDNYSIDGINLDYIRYPNSLPTHFPGYLDSTWGYTEVAIAEFKSQYNQNPYKLSPSDPNWEKWINYRQEKVNSTVKELYYSIKSSHPDLEISAVVFPNLEKAKIQKLQDWKDWVECRYIDLLTPIILGSSVDLIETYVKNISSITGEETPVIIGNFGTFNNDSPVNVIRQILSTENSCVKGINIFDYAHLNDKYIEALLEGPFKSTDKN